MQLVEQGRLSLHDPVQKYIPYFLPKGAMNGADVTVWYDRTDLHVGPIAVS